MYDAARGADDRTVVEKAYAKGRILITNDKDFGERIYREGQQDSPLDPFAPDPLFCEERGSGR